MWHGFVPPEGSTWAALSFNNGFRTLFSFRAWSDVNDVNPIRNDGWLIGTQGRIINPPGQSPMDAIITVSMSCSWEDVWQQPGWMTLWCAWKDAGGVQHTEQTIAATFGAVVPGNTISITGNAEFPINGFTELIFGYIIRYESFIQHTYQFETMEYTSIVVPS